MLRPLSCALALALGGVAAPGLSLAGTALPTGLQVVHGQAQVSTQGPRMTVSNTPGAILNWNSFSVGTANAVHFQQQNAASQVLNRVTGNNPSQILGSLSSNGRVWLLNPHGVLFGQGARVDVAGLVSSTLQISDRDWLAGRYSFQAADGLAAPLVNQGELRSSFGGQIALIGGSVRNEGLIDAAGGQVLLAAGQTVELVDSSAPHLALRLRAPEGEVLNLGTVAAGGGRIDIHAGLVNQQGIARADALEAGSGGVVTIRARQNLNLSAGSLTSADGGSGGQLRLDSGEGRSLLAGTVSAQGSQDKGGRIELLGRQIGLLDGARVDASGQRGGGEVLVGGGPQGRDASLPNAEALYFAAGAELRADAGQVGDGGRLILWSNQSTRAFGSLSAEGGSAGGHGGFIETSGGWLDARPRWISTAAAQGQAGTWLLDPFNITISDQVPNSGYDPLTFTANGNDATISTATLNAALQAGTHVQVSTAGAGNQAGNILLDDAHILVSSANPGRLTLRADADITIHNSVIESRGGAFAVSLSASTGQSAGAVQITDSTLRTQGGTLTIGGPNARLQGLGSGYLTAVGSAAAVDVRDSTLDVGDRGLILIRAQRSADALPGGTAIALGSGSRLLARDISLNGLVLSGSSETNNQISTGVSLMDSQLTAFHGLFINGLSVDGVGVDVGGQTQMNLLNQVDGARGTDSRSGLTIVGNALDWGTGIRMDGRQSARSLASVLNNGSLSLESDGLIRLQGNADLPQPLLDLSGASKGTMVSQELLMDGASIRGPRGLLTLDGGERLQLDSSRITSNGPLRLLGDSVLLRGETQVRSNARNEALVLGGSAQAGSDGLGIGFFNNSAGAEALLAPNGRWLIYAYSPQDVEAFRSGDLPYDFKQYGISFPQAPEREARGNGFLYSQSFGAEVSGQAFNKVYDGSHDAQTAQLDVQGLLRGDHFSGGRFVSKDAGIGISVEARVFDANDKPVYGYRFNQGLRADIAPRELTADLEFSKVYDGGRAIAYSTVLDGQHGLVGLETVQLSANGLFEDKNAGTDKPLQLTFSLQDGDNGGLAGNYRFAPAPVQRGRIDPRPLQLSGLQAVSKVYDGGLGAVITGQPRMDALEGDVLSLSALSGRFLDKNVGTAKPVQLSEFSLTGPDAGNYVLQMPAALQADISPATLSLQGLNALNKIYDGGTVATLSGAASVSGFAGDQLSVSGGSARFLDKNAGTAKPVELSGFSLFGADAGNYQLSAVQLLSADINPAPLALSGLSAQSKVYDASTAAGLLGTAQVQALPGDSVQVLTGSASFLSKSAGQGKAVQLNGFALTGEDAGNYQLQLPQDLRADIRPAPLQISGLTAQDKVYDGSLGATLGGTAALAALPGDQVQLSGGTASFSDKNVGQGKPVLLSGFGLSGPDAGNYSLEALPSLSADISPAPLSLQGLLIRDKVYDGNTAASWSGQPGVQALGGDLVSLNTGTARFLDKNAGAAKAVLLSGFELAGADAGNYRLELPGSLLASITPAPLSLEGLTVLDKVYDASTAANLQGQARFNTVAGDSVLLSEGTARFVDKNAGAAKPVLLSGFVLSGADAGNYQLQLPENLSAAITPRAISLSGLAVADKSYDGSTAASLLAAPRIEGLAGDQLGVQIGSASFADKNAGDNKPVLLSGFALSGADAGNYSLQAPVGLSAAINPALLQYVATPTVKGLGDAMPVLSGTVSGFVAGESLQTALTGELQFSTDASARSPAGSYAVRGQGLQALNYRFEQAPENATALTVAGVSPTASLSQNAGNVLNSALRPATAPAATGAGGLLDMLQAPAAGAAAAGSLGAGPARVSFEQMPLAEMSPDAVAGLLNSRDLYKKSVFAHALARLEQDPTLGEMSLCLSLEELEQGECLMTDEQKAELQALRRKALAQDQQPFAGAPAGAVAATAASSSTPAAAEVSTSQPSVAASTVQPAAKAQPLLGKRRVLSASLPQIVRKVAVIVGINEYTDASIPRLGNAVADAQAIAKLFSETLGYETLLIPNASKRALVSALNRLAIELDTKDSVVIYYAGHGELVKATGRGYWQLSDSDAQRPETWLANSDISRLVAKFGASQVALISDSCYSGSLVAADERIRANARQIDPQTVLDRRSVVVMSSGGNEPVFDEGKNGHSPFAWNLMKTLNQVGAWQLGGNVFERVRFAVARELPQRPQYGSSQAAGHQQGGDYLFETRRLEGNN